MLAMAARAQMRGFKWIIAPPTNRRSFIFCFNAKSTTVGTKPTFVSWAENGRSPSNTRHS
jgi:hypothetical protein